MNWVFRCNGYISGELDKKKGTTPKVTTKLETDSIEVKRLRKALKEKELELEILKKAVHIFSKSDGKSINL